MALAFALHSCAAAPPEPGLDTVVTTFTDEMSPDQPYRAPTTAERRSAAAGFAALLDCRDPAGLEALGFSVRDGVDPATGRPYTIAVDVPGTERAWGLYVIDRSARPSLAVEVPHPAFDLRTELFGVDLFRRVPGSVLLVAGAHRKAGDGTADVAHEPGSVFHAVAAELAGRGLAQVQLHGFHDENLPTTDIVLSSGVAPPGTAAPRTAARLTAAGFAVCRAWAQRCGDLEGTTNAQGATAAADNSVFLHVELSRTVRDSPERRADVVRALAEAVP
ncbi:hypothetical protein M8542_08875 [Amycolatopsis sp. OK19-0408]|uniref:Uncharacterized protein n=1 Tax=Amycolatopsis iheyensis TaxID=2945988 RepID=A0A9X2N999_9PSEU|nr:hypothetical protein [Amycolatopsis iheyensis]MCR6482931.1 hypothetical protein [Amycolatopsis iheyensis]